MPAGSGEACRSRVRAQVMTEGGPWHSRKLQSGEEFMERLRRRFLEMHSPEQQRGGQLVHRPFARLVVLRRAGGEGGGSARSCL
jgi:hypothetical protein